MHPSSILDRLPRRASAVALALVTAGAVALAAPRAHACDYALGPPPPPRFPWFSQAGFPTNGMFTSGLEWRTVDGVPLQLVPDVAMSLRLGHEVRRPVGGALAPGARFVPTEDCPARGSCRHTLVVGSGPDLTPPGRAIIRVLVTLLPRVPRGAGGFSCPDVDELQLTVEGSDDTTPTEHLTMLAYMGPTPEAALARPEPDAAFGSPSGGGGGLLTADILLGESISRARSGAPFRAAGPFCFAIALMDQAGNIGPRSDARCLDTTDVNDPTVVLVDTPSCRCSVVGAGATGARGGRWGGAVGALLAAMGLRRRGATARRVARGLMG